jgi:proteasome accessory factor B
MKRASLRRIYELDRMIRMGKLKSAEQAAREFEVNTRTIERDLEELRHDLGADLVYNKAHGCYQYAGSTKPFVLPAQWLTEREIAILLIAERALRIFTSTSFQSEIHPAFNKLLNPIRHDKKAMDYIADLCNGVHFHRPVEPLRDVRQEFSIVLDAIMQRKRLSLIYHTSGKETCDRREFDPYSLINNGGEWYVVGHCRNAKAERTFVLSQIRDPQMLDSFFAVPKEFSVSQYLEHGFGRMQVGTAPEKIALRISPPASAWIGRNAWHPSQKIAQAKDNTIILSMTCPVTDSMVRWVLQMGECVVVEKPESLRKMVKEKAQRVVENQG